MKRLKTYQLFGSKSIKRQRLIKIRSKVNTKKLQKSSKLLKFFLCMFGVKMIPQNAVTPCTGCYSILGYQFNSSGNWFFLKQFLNKSTQITLRKMNNFLKKKTRKTTKPNKTHRKNGKQSKQRKRDRRRKKKRRNKIRTHPLYAPRSQ